MNICGLPEFLSKPYLSNCHCHNEEKMTLSVDISLGAKIRRELTARVLKVLDGEAG